MAGWEVGAGGRSALVPLPTFGRRGIGTAVARREPFQGETEPRLPPSATVCSFIEFIQGAKYHR